MLMNCSFNPNALRKLEKTYEKSYFPPYLTVTLNDIPVQNPVYGENEMNQTAYI